MDEKNAQQRMTAAKENKRNSMYVDRNKSLKIQYVAREQGMVKIKKKKTKAMQNNFVYK